ncbi:MAG: DUF58 domain-containing protein [Hungatella sp.]|nr:DUF58 domain-containing protein [Hungatella sp.]
MKLFVMALTALILWTLQGVLYRKLWTKHLTACLAFDRRSAVEGERGVLTETITNAKSLPLPILHVKFQMGKDLVFTSSSNSKITDYNYRSDIFSCMPWQKIRRNLEFCCNKRGYYTISQVQLVSYDLFFSGHFVTFMDVDAGFYVYPRAVDSCRMEPFYRNLMGQILSRQALLPDPFETQSVRPYEPYDPYRIVNWKATARTGSLKVNVYAPTASWQVMFLLDVDSDRLWKDEALTEEAIRLCGSYSQRLIKEGVPVSLRTNGRDSITGGQAFIEAGAGGSHARAIMDLLARIRIDLVPHPSMEQVLEETACFSTGHDKVICILLSPSQHPSMARAFSALCRRAPGSQWILPVRPGEDVRLEHQGDFSVFFWEVPYDYS